MIDRKKELSELLKKLRKVDTNNHTDIDLILEYLEDFVNNSTRYNSNESKKFIACKVEKEPSSFHKIYRLSWRQSLTEIINKKV